MPHTQSQEPPPVLAFEEPEQEFHTNLRSRLSQVRVLAPILFSPSCSTPSSPSHTSTSPFSISPDFFDMAEEIPPRRRTSPSGGRFPGRDIVDDNHDDQIVYIASMFKNI
ncbi:hypothetical protein E3N88_20669 [Mikania micrantha]|uniref:Uncharacterized protein n=1 Tax=Mikania micrantha TaxID=192012 RepID=A0A5N6NHM4_9ASTR|nr:hypothetical protein E3N88_20669 [Mikania micrantha]